MVKIGKVLGTTTPGEKVVKVRFKHDELEKVRKCFRKGFNHELEVAVNDR